MNHLPGSVVLNLTKVKYNVNKIYIIKDLCLFILII